MNKKYKLGHQRLCATFNRSRSAHYTFSTDVADRRADGSQKKLAITFKQAQTPHKYPCKIERVEFILQTVSEKIRFIEPRNTEWSD